MLVAPACVLLPIWLLLDELLLPDWLLLEPLAQACESALLS